MITRPRPAAFSTTAGSAVSKRASTVASLAGVSAR